MARWLVTGALLVLIALSPTAAPALPWRFLSYENGGFVWTELQLPDSGQPASGTPRMADGLAPAGDVAASVLADVTGDGQPEWVVLVWSPWKDWPIQKWLPVPSPIADFRDARGDCCSVVLVDPGDGRVSWAGSALPVPMLALEVGDVDGDGQNELVTLEGDYALGRDGPGRHVVVWSWRDFGFEMDWRSERLYLRELSLFGAPRAGILSIGVR